MGSAALSYQSFLQMDRSDPVYVFSYVSSLSDPSTYELSSNIKPFVFDLQGSFTYDIYGNLTGGVVTSIVETYEGSILNIPDLTITGLASIDAVTLVSILTTDQNFIDMWRLILRGGDLIRGGNGGANHLYGFGSGGDEIIGAHSNDVLIGFGGHNTIIGSGSHDWIDGGPGANVLVSGSEETKFNFFSSDNIFSDWIRHFQPGTPAQHDVLALHSLPGLSNFHQVKNNEFIYDGHVVIHDNIGDDIILGNIHHKANLHPYDFHFLA
jgi:Ca2+-binding RTX toxin-like protein